GLEIETFGASLRRQLRELLQRRLGRFRGEQIVRAPAFAAQLGNCLEVTSRAYQPRERRPRERLPERHQNAVERLPHERVLVTCDCPLRRHERLEEAYGADGERGREQRGVVLKLANLEAASAEVH